jgi:predicted metal-dependent hydrolase
MQRMAKAKSFQLPPDQPYRIRQSARAKHVSIKVSHLGEVEVVVPQGISSRRISEIVSQRQDWIAKTIQRLKTEREALQLEPEPFAVEGRLPERIFLRAIAEDWVVTYTQTDGSQVRAMTTAPNRLSLSGQIDHVETCQQVLQRWLKRKAQLHFVPWLRQVSQEIVLPCGKISIRQQKTRWASCSNYQSISLNLKLLFLPASLVRYVFIHELCHTVHLNHSSEFWALVAEKEAEWESLDRELSRGWRYVPEWVERTVES